MDRNWNQLVLRHDEIIEQMNSFSSASEVTEKILNLDSELKRINSELHLGEKEGYQKIRKNWSLFS